MLRTASRARLTLSAAAVGVAALSLALVGGAPALADDDPAVAISQTVWSPGAVAQGILVTAYTNQATWSASSDQAWLTVAPATGPGGARMTVLVMANATSAARTGTVTVTAGGANAALVVTQAGATMPPSVTLSATTWAPGHLAQSTGIVINSNQQGWSAASDATWLTFAPAAWAANTTMTLSVTANPTTAARTGTVTVTSGGATATVTVTQAGIPFVSVAPASWEPTFAAQSAGVVVSTNQAAWSASSDAAWLTVSPATGADGATLTVTVASNNSNDPRTGTVTLTAGPASATFVVTQEEMPPIDGVGLSANAWNPPAAGGSVTIAVSTNRPSWEVTAIPVWLTVTPVTGVHGDTFVVTASANTGGSRSGVVTVTAGGTSTVLVVNQAGTGAVVSTPTSYWAPGSGMSSIQLLVTTDQAVWTATTSHGWITVNPPTGGSGTVATIVIPQNTTGAPRTGSVQFIVGGATTLFVFEQAG